MVNMADDVVTWSQIEPGAPVMFEMYLIQVLRRVCCTLQSALPAGTRPCESVHNQAIGLTWSKGMVSIASIGTDCRSVPDTPKTMQP